MLLVAALRVEVVVTCRLSAVVISGVRVLASVRRVETSVRPPVLVKGPWLWLDDAVGVRAAALDCTARVEEEEEEVEGTVWRMVASVTGSVMELTMVLLGQEDEVGGGGDVVAVVRVVEVVAFKVFSSVI